MGCCGGAGDLAAERSGGCCCGGGAAGGTKGGFFARLESFCARPATLTVSGVALVLSLVLMYQRTGHIGCHGGADGFTLADPAVLTLVLCGFPILRGAVQSLFRLRRIKSSLLMTLAMIACAAIGEIFAAGEVAFIMALGEKLEDWTVRRARKGLHKLVSLVPATAHRVVTCPKCRARGEFVKDVPVAAVKVGESVIVRPGEAIPVDGTVSAGETTVDQSAMTGESELIAKKPGDEVYSGTINQFGEITVSVTKVGADSSIQKLVRLVKEAEARQAPLQRIADKWAAILVPISLGIAVCTFFGCWGVMGDFNEALTRGVTILVVFCPCALALATPTSIAAAIGQATKHGVIIKSGEALEKMGRVTVACFDKTGTLQTGERLRDGARATVAALAAGGVRSVMLSGDREEIARRFAGEAGIGEVRFGCKPEDKSTAVEELQRTGERVLMVGDGINDAIALKVADVGVAMGGMGTDIAQEAADVSLITDDLTAIPYLRRLSVACVRTIKLNITISMMINAVAITCSILGLLGPVTGALVHNVGSVLVVLNAALLYDRRFV